MSEILQEISPRRSGVARADDVQRLIHDIRMGQDRPGGFFAQQHRGYAWGRVESTTRLASDLYAWEYNLKRVEFVDRYSVYEVDRDWGVGQTIIAYNTREHAASVGSPHNLHDQVRVPLKVGQVVRVDMHMLFNPGSPTSEESIESDEEEETTRPTAFLMGLFEWECPELIHVTLEQDGGSNGTASSAATYTYTVKYGSLTLGTEQVPWGRPHGAVSIATQGIAKLGSRAGVVLLFCNEFPQTTTCE